ncbi:MAG: hypothetical protein A3F72_15935 [Bacteroidetes bacterium RIFCSPLOWO2_12_FULL_35_15]|nr:MAG: hypothetical protein A3F72_15935 [Bacteroidetes bacterium RIFCSPLOWO2_12_FULL_35_15]
MKPQLIIVLTLLLLVTSCKKLDNISFNDNPYDKDYDGPRVVKIDTITTEFGVGVKNKIYYTKSFDNNDGIRLYRNGFLLTTQYNSVIHSVDIPDSSPTSGVTYTYEVRLFLGSGETSSEPFSYTTP